MAEEEKLVVDQSTDPLEMLGRVFPRQNIEQLPQLSPGAPLEEMANYVIEHDKQFPEHPAPKTTIPEDQLEPTFVTFGNTAGDPNFKKKLFDAFYEDFTDYIGLLFNRRHDVVYDKELCNRMLHQHFLYCRTPLIELLVEEFSGRYVLAALICFFVENFRGYLVRRYFLHIDHDQWTIMSYPMLIPRRRRHNWLPAPEQGPMADSIREYHAAMRRFHDGYEQIFHPDTGKLLPAEAIESQQGEAKFECIVCTGIVPLGRAIACDSKEQQQPVDLSKPSTSQQHRQSEQHRFCIECLIGHAKAATQEMPLARGGVGLPCMAPDCSNPILFSHCRFYIPPAVRRQLNSRIVEENLGTAKLANLERCNQCNFAMIVEVPVKEMRVFSCLKCHAEHCRQCQRPWDSLHFGLPCKEVLGAKEEMRKAFENKLSETIIRRCHHCSVPFVKEVGCNRMHCRCGATQCYICRAENINYNHFCQHFRSPGQKDCKQCKTRRCLLWQEDEDAEALKKVHQEAEEAGVEWGGDK